MAIKRPRAPAAGLDAGAIDALYGLEPVFEPATHGAPVSEGAEGAQFETVHCPYCGESFQTLADYSAGGATYIEDCQICCQPIELKLTVDANGALASLEARRLD
ncbi:MAG: CPXCG motif-containing cysteine-rich protein [Steroidobacteraceae bacterium]|jgi:hypothetical protein